MHTYIYIYTYMYTNNIYIYICTCGICDNDYLGQLRWLGCLRKLGWQSLLTGWLAYASLLHSCNDMMLRPWLYCTDARKWTVLMAQGAILKHWRNDVRRRPSKPHRSTAQPSTAKHRTRQLRTAQHTTPHLTTALHHNSPHRTAPHHTTPHTVSIIYITIILCDIISYYPVRLFKVLYCVTMFIYTMLHDALHVYTYV